MRQEIPVTTGATRVALQWAELIAAQHVMSPDGVMIKFGLFARHSQLDRCVSTL